MILVVGTGRCGTSAVCEALEGLGVDMGGKGEVKDATPQGDYERPDWRALDWALIREEITAEGWAERAVAMATALDATGTEWGVKHPAMCEFMPLVMGTFPGAGVIWVRRHLGDTIKSWKNHFQAPDGYCEVSVPHRHWTIARALWNRPHLQVDMTRRVGEAELKRALSQGLATLTGQEQWASLSG